MHTLVTLESTTTTLGYCTWHHLLLDARVLKIMKALAYIGSIAMTRRSHLLVAARPIVSRTASVLCDEHVFMIVQIFVVAVLNRVDDPRLQV
jgi:hypothetical protein